MSNKHCVYYHKLDGEVIYVGVGEPHRPSQRDFRSRRWQKLIGEGDFPEVEIVKWFEDRVQAEAFEVSEIKRLRPKANNKHNHDDSRQLRLSEKAYQLVRKAAFKRHVPMVEVLDEIILAAFAAKQD